MDSTLDYTVLSVTSAPLRNSENLFPTHYRMMEFSISLPNPLVQTPKSIRVAAMTRSSRAATST
jgi:hypothetical protein